MVFSMNVFKNKKRWQNKKNVNKPKKRFFTSMKYVASNQLPLTYQRKRIHPV